ncbi:hypothetical protein [Arsenophonus nasoniae]
MQGGKILTKANFSHFFSEAILYQFDAGTPILPECWRLTRL